MVGVGWEEAILHSSNLSSQGCPSPSTAPQMAVHREDSLGEPKAARLELRTLPLLQAACACGAGQGQTSLPQKKLCSDEVGREAEDSLGRKNPWSPHDGFRANPSISPRHRPF